MLSKRIPPTPLTLALLVACAFAPLPALAQGAPAAIEKYRQLRHDALLGQYNFGEWEINELARRLTEAGDVKAALAVLEMNQEFYPNSVELPRLIAAAKKQLEAR